MSMSQDSSSLTATSTNSNGQFKMQVKTLIGTRFFITTYPSDDIKTIKTRIALQESLEPSHQHLIYNSRELSDHETVENVGLNEDSILTLVMTLKGGPVTMRNKNGELPTFRSKFLSAATAAAAAEIQQQLLQNEQISKMSDLLNEDLEIVLVKCDGSIYVYRMGERKKRARGANSNNNKTDDDEEDEEETDNDDELDDITDESEDDIKCSFSFMSNPLLIGPKKVTRQQIVENKKTKARMENVQRKLAKQREKKRTQMVKQGRASIKTARRLIPSPKCKGIMSSNDGPLSQRGQFTFPKSAAYTTAINTMNLIKAEILLQSKRWQAPGSLPYTLTQLERYVKCKLFIALEDEGHPRSFIPKSHPVIPTVISKRSEISDDDEELEIANGFDSDNDFITENHWKLAKERPSSSIGEEIPSPDNLYSSFYGLPICVEAEDGLRKRNGKKDIDEMLDNINAESSSEEEDEEDDDGEELMKRVRTFNMYLKSETARLQKIAVACKRASDFLEYKEAVGAVIESQLQQFPGPDGTQELLVDTSKKNEPIPDSGKDKQQQGAVTTEGAAAGETKPSQQQKKEKDDSKKENKNSNSKRCGKCNKKLSIVNEYQCRCGKYFCSTHRHAEDHDCTYDYKAEGRRLIEKANPVVTAPKLPQI